MFKFLVAVGLVIVVATVVEGQGRSEECRRPPTVDPRTCCNITKSFDKTEFPECFSDEVAAGAGGFRGSNRQRRSAYGGQGSPWGGSNFGGHGYGGDQNSHHGPPGHYHGGFNGDQQGHGRGGGDHGSWRGEQGHGRGGYQGNWRGEQGNGRGGGSRQGQQGNSHGEGSWRGQQGNSYGESSWRGGQGYGQGYGNVQTADDENRDRGTSVYRGTVKYYNSGARAPDQSFRNSKIVESMWRDGQRGLSDASGRSFAGEGASGPGGQAGPTLGVFSCQIDCYMSKTKILDNNVVNRQIAIEKLKNIFITIPHDLLISSVDKCANRLNTFTANGSNRSDLPPPLRDLPNNCSHTGGFFFMCIHHEIFLSCPADNWNGSDECDALKDFVEKCRPGRRSDTQSS